LNTSTRARCAPERRSFLGFQTDCTSTGEDRERFHGSISPPIFEASTFVFPTYEAFSSAFPNAAEGSGRSPVYTRGLNPTVQAVEEKIALLERAGGARLFASGMAAISAAILSAARSGDHVLAVRSIYSNAYRLLQGYLPTLGITTTFADFTDLDAVEAAVRPDTRVLYLESPGNPAMHIVDLEGVAALARNHGLVTVMDNTLATPYNQRPLEMGVDLVVHSVSKYLAGHSDVVAGAVAGSEERVRAISANEIRDLGGIIGPFEAWLILRGIRTLGLRMQAHNRMGLNVACWLERRPEVERVFYAGLPSHPQHSLAARQMRGFSGLMGVVVRGGMQAGIEFANALRLFGIGVSWGGFESLALPMSLDDPALTRDLGVVPGFVRLSIGLEDEEDLLADLDQALRGIA
jgi:methionine-gamma-lyase